MRKYHLHQARSCYATAQHAKKFGMWMSFLIFRDSFRAHMAALREEAEK